MNFFFLLKFRSKKMFVKKKFVQKKFGQTKFLVKKILVKKVFAHKKILFKKIFWLKKNFGPRCFRFLSKKNWVGLTLGLGGWCPHPKLVGLKLCWVVDSCSKICFSPQKLYRVNPGGLLRSGSGRAEKANILYLYCY